MVNNRNNVLTTSQTMVMIAGSMIGIGILSLPANLAKVAHNDGWIGVIIGSLYPFYMVICSFIIFKDSSYQNINIVEISKIYFGKFFGSLLGFIFTLQFLAYIIITSGNISNMLRVYLVLFLEQYKLAIPILLISVYTASKGIRALGRINEVIFYASIPLILLTVLALKQGNILNIKPILGTPISDILKASIEPVYSFVGIEIIFLIVPLMKDKTKIKISFLKATVIIVFLYIWLSFVSIYYLGPDIAKKLYWPTLSLAETISIPGISNFKFVFMFLWSSIIFKTIANQNYFFYYSLSSIFKKIAPNILYLLVFLFAAISVSRLDSFILLKKINKGISIFYLIFNLIFITIITIITLVKNGGKNEKASSKANENFRE
ncbi:spore gernimation protein [Clostridium sporogenes]|uniref:Spore gernimation protein n=2 Tax=Clostridium sporogenes TaxID=1509 RepID=A0A7X5P6K8_CLOSG|nr:endospore germination permease [Clostridium sporogenes]AJD29768.1 spore germination family protein [Clostridium botulinum Prevot_594]MBA4507722.1 endospore germination permease [Clostridium sporogenes]MBW5456338.1 endospore germination permease [Clostridium sporogenes]MDU6334927.1 endospore germination permease [Clostridium sporogenes]NFG02668.1 spore gernimation protein [Clostridium sporogenes]